MGIPPSGVGWLQRKVRLVERPPGSRVKLFQPAVDPLKCPS
jgi:hypothetical protein